MLINFYKSKIINAVHKKVLKTEQNRFLVIYNCLTFAFLDFKCDFKSEQNKSETIHAISSLADIIVANVIGQLQVNALYNGMVP